DVTIRAGDAFSGGNGGDIVLRAGDAQNSQSGGSIVLRPGDGGADATRAASERSDATIGILTALPIDFAPMQLILDGSRRYEPPGSRSGEIYIIVSVPTSSGSARQVVVGLLPDMGNNSAVVSAAVLIHHFPSVRDIIMCGIAGGVPRPGTA